VQGFYGAVYEFVQEGVVFKRSLFGAAKTSSGIPKRIGAKEVLCV
jgi:hypothetical protein